MKYIAIISLLLSLSQVLTAQHTKGEVVLKNGDVITGSIVQQNIGQGVTIQTMDGEIIRIEESEIKQITQSTQKVNTSIRGIYIRQKGFYQRFSFGMGFTEGTRIWDGRRTQFVSTTLEMVSGIRFSPKVNIGLGLGGTFFGDGTSVVPLYVDFRGDWDLRGANSAVVPHYFLDLGYGFAGSQGWDRNYERYEGGLFMHGGLGLKFRSRGRAEWTLTAGLRRQNVYEEYTLWNDQNTVIEGNRAKQSLEFQLGFMF